MNPTLPRVTVAIPLFNGMPLIEQALASITKQTYTNIRIVISDNCSTDGTYEYCLRKAEEDPRIVVHRHETNIGVWPNFEFLTKFSDTEFFMYFAHDDEWDHTFIARAVEIFDRDPDIGCVFSHLRSWNHATKSLSEVRRPIPSGGTTPFRRLCEQLISPTSSLFYGLARSRCLIPAIRQATKRFDYSDLFIIQCLSMSGNISIIPIDLYRAGIKTKTRVARAIKKNNIYIYPYFIETSKIIFRSFGFTQSVILLCLLSFLSLRLFIKKPRAPAGGYDEF